MNDVHFVYAEPAIADKQRAVVEPQLKAMREGRPSILFQAVGDILKVIVPPVRTPVTLLDAGCGSAYYYEVIEHFVPDRFLYIGADYNLGMVVLAREIYPSLAIHQMDLCALDFDNRSFDVVLSGACIAHVKEWGLALSEIIRVADSYLILHRNPIWLDDTPTMYIRRKDYDVDVLVYRFNEHELLSKVLGDFDVIISKDVCSPTARTVTRTYLFRRKQ